MKGRGKLRRTFGVGNFQIQASQDNGTLACYEGTREVNKGGTLPPVGPSAPCADQPVGPARRHEASLAGAAAACAMFRPASVARTAHCPGQVTGPEPVAITTRSPGEAPASNHGDTGPTPGRIDRTTRRPDLLSRSGTVVLSGDPGIPSPARDACGDDDIAAAPISLDSYRQPLFLESLTSLSASGHSTRRWRQQTRLISRSRRPDRKENR
jgi:hypothetical protein